MKKAAPDDEAEGMTERIIIPVKPAMSDAIKEYWHTERLNSKSEALRRLIQIGLDVEQKRLAKR